MAAFSEALDVAVASRADIIQVRSDISGLHAEMVAHEARPNGEITLVKWMLGAVLATALANFARRFF